MQRVGMRDSPWVRRVAISLQRLGLPFEHRSISVSAVAWFFARQRVPGAVPVDPDPALRDPSARAEATPEFAAAAHGEAPYPVAA